MGIEELKAKITNNAETIDFRGTKFKVRVIQLNLVLDLIDQWQTPIDSDEGWDIPEGKFVMGDDLPTQPELVEVPVVKQFIADWYEEHRNDTLEAKFSRAKTDKDIKVQNWYNNCEGRHVNKRANAQEIIAKMTLYGYTVKKEQLYYVKVGNLAFVDWEDSFVAKLATTDSPAWTNYAHKIPTKDGAENIARIIGGEAVPVDQEPKLPQEIEVSEYLEEEAE